MLYGISDLHLDITGQKSMQVFGEKWFNYEEKIFNNWEKIVGQDDWVLVPGDISWAMRTSEAIFDLKRLEKLPGKKILLKGNHDYWWQSLSKLNSLRLENIFFLQNNSYDLGKVNICGSRGWLSLDSQNASLEDKAIYLRELERLKISLQSVNNNKEIIVITHYPPFNKHGYPNDFGKILENYNVKKCYYGHLHGDGLYSVVEEEINGIEYKCISADYIDFMPVLIMGDYDGTGTRG